MKNLLLLTIVVMITACKNEAKTTSTDPARALIEKVVSKTGSMDDLKKLKDVEYTYTLNAIASNVKNVSIERYIFDGEFSWAQYIPEQQSPIKTDTVTQGYNGYKAWVKVNDTLSTDVNKITFSGFIRPTNFYWFTMMQKLLDPGINYKMLENRIVAKKEYKVIKMNFNAGIGEVQDQYILYVNPQTKLIDQFLFTVKELNIAPDEPLLMQVDYETIDGITLMANRTVRKSDWNGKIDGEIVYKQHYENIKFNNGFSKNLFEQ